MRNTKSLIEDDNATGGMCAFVIIGGLSSVFLFVEGQIFNVLTLCPCSLPVLSSAFGALKGSLCTLLANLITA